MSTTSDEPEEPQESVITSSIETSSPQISTEPENTPAVPRPATDVKPRPTVSVPDITAVEPYTYPRGTMVYDEATEQWFFIDDEGVPRGAMHYDPDDPSTWYLDDDGIPRGAQTNAPNWNLDDDGTPRGNQEDNPYTGVTTTVVGSIAFVVSLGAFIYLRKRK